MTRIKIDPGYWHYPATQFSVFITDENHSDYYVGEIRQNEEGHWEGGRKKLDDYDDGETVTTDTRESAIEFILETLQGALDDEAATAKDAAEELRDLISHLEVTP